MAAHLAAVVQAARGLSNARDWGERGTCCREKEKKKLGFVPECRAMYAAWQTPQTLCMRARQNSPAIPAKGCRSNMAPSSFICPLCRPICRVRITSLRVGFSWQRRIPDADLASAWPYPTKNCQLVCAGRKRSNHEEKFGPWKLDGMDGL